MAEVSPTGSLAFASLHHNHTREKRSCFHSTKITQRPLNTVLKVNCNHSSINTTLWESSDDASATDANV